MQRCLSIGLLSAVFSFVDHKVGTATFLRKVAHFLAFSVFSFSSTISLVHMFKSQSSSTRCISSTHNPSIRSDKRLTIHTSGSLSLHGGNLTLITLFDTKIQRFTFTTVSSETNLACGIQTSSLQSDEIIKRRNGVLHRFSYNTKTCL